MKLAALLALVALGTACGAFDSSSAGASDPTPADAPPGGATRYGAPVRVARDLVDPRGVALDDGFVYYSVEGGGTLHAVRRDGSDSRILAANEPDVRDIVVDGSRVYWAARGRNSGCNGGNRGLASLRKDGSDRVQLFDECQNAVRMVGDALNLYFTSKESKIWRVAKDGSATTTLTDADRPSAIAPGGGLVFWTSQAGGTVSAHDGVAPAPRILAANQAAPIDIVADGTTVYWIVEGGSLFKLDAAAASPEPIVLARGQSSPARLAMNATELYWTNAGSGTIASVAKAGGDVRILASDQRTPFAIAADVDTVAWTNIGDGSVHVLRRTP